jgi:hypothetical protein
MSNGRIVMTGLNMTNEQCEALFASALQRSDVLTAEVVTEAIGAAVRALGSSGCADRMAQEFGDHPEAATERMLWARQVLSDMPAGSPTASSADRGDCGARVPAVSESAVL